MYKLNNLDYIQAGVVFQLNEIMFQRCDVMLLNLLQNVLLQNGMQLEEKKNELVFTVSVHSY